MSTELVTWKEEMASIAKAAAAAEAAANQGLPFLSTQGGQLKFNNEALPGNQLVVSILDYVFENVYYEGRYDADNPQGPKAFALARDPEDMVWHENSAPEYAGKPCKGSDILQWGSAETGKGKACRETRRLALVPVGTLKDGELSLLNEAAVLASPLAFLRLPVTSVKGFSTYVQTTANVLGRPPLGIATRIYIEPSAKNQFSVKFEALEVLMTRRNEALQVIETPYPKWNEQPAVAVKDKRKY